MGKSLLEKETNQTNTRTISARSIVEGSIPLDDLPQPYVIIGDSMKYDQLSKAINILAIKQNYRIVSFATISPGGDAYVIMERREK